MALFCFKGIVAGKRSKGNPQEGWEKDNRGVFRRTTEVSSVGQQRCLQKDNRGVFRRTTEVSSVGQQRCLQNGDSGWF